MFERLRRKWFGTEFILFQYGHDMLIRKVKVWPTGEKTIKLGHGYRRLSESNSMLSGEGRYFKLT